ncbi:OmpP1/FadL family transporter [Aliiruegeria lutimaris]|uniref:Long-chain fatty acid transport protein n=1 Tax=Aliiruegeria lutimaris TaxID=571298 RepID=A0A1G8L2K5_9RHOB|nr:outer membrane protein transport protein [Aliiruegeria lutimaris]SDI49886.1 Long-chain fatty acid transport protein [Aliiruegeria lutimaris]
MKTWVTTVSLFALTAGGAVAGGLDRTGQPIQALFESGGENGNYAELGFAKTFVNLDGTGVGIDSYSAIDPSLNVPGGTGYSNVGNDFSSFGAALKLKFTEKWSGAIIIENPYGADVSYSGDPMTTELGGTSALAETTSATFYLRYKFDDNWSAHGGLRLQKASGDITLSGRSYGLTEQAARAAAYQAALAGYPSSVVSKLAGTASGYSVELEEDWALGYVLGASYEIPSIAARISLTYNSEIEHEMATTESGPTVLVGVDPSTGAPIAVPVYDGESTTKVKTPQSVNLEFRTGIASDTLLFGSVRWVDWSAFRIDPKNFMEVTGSGLVDLEDTTTYAIGIGRKFTEEWAASIAVSYEAAGDDMVSPLAPTTGLWAVAVGASYDMGNMTITGGVRHSWLGDANAETGTPDTTRAIFESNSGTSVGLRIGYDF